MAQKQIKDGEEFKNNKISFLPPKWRRRLLHGVIQNK